MKSLLTVICSLIVLSGLSQTLPSAKVDERVELLSIVFRMAGANSYSNTVIQTYSTDINNYFDKYKNDELILYTRNLIHKKGIGENAPVSLALHINIQNGTILLNQKLSNQGIDKRWGNSIAEFISLLNLFYTKTNFSQFYAGHASLYDAAEKSFEQSNCNVDKNFFNTFFGEPKGDFEIILMLAVERANYGVTVKDLSGQEKIFSLICPWETDSLGVPKYDPETEIPITIHEYCHSYCNPLIDAYYTQLENSANKSFKLVRRQMEYQSYGEPIIMLDESFVRASTIMYLKNHGASGKEIMKYIKSEMLLGFIWTEELVNLFSTYEESREKYTSLNSYMPVIVEKMNSLDYKKINKDVHCVGNAEIVNCSIQNNDKDISPDVKEVKFYFNTPMSGRRGLDNRGKYPNISSFNWNNEHTELVISFVLKPNTDYIFKLPAKFFSDENLCEMKTSYTLTFKTKSNLP